MDIIFTPSLDQTDKTVTISLSDSQVSACDAFIATQNAGTPGKYAGVGHLLASNLHDGLLDTLVPTFPSASVTTAKAAHDAAAAAYDTAVAAANSPLYSGSDPVVITPYA